MVDGTEFSIAYTTDGFSTVFAYPYYLFEFSDLVVEFKDSFGNVTLLELDVHYSLAGTADEFGTYPDGVNLTTMGGLSPLAANGTLLLSRSTRHTQEQTWIDNSSFPADQEEHAFDKLTLMIQEIAKGFIGFLAGPPTTPGNQNDWFIVYPAIAGSFFGYIMTTTGWKPFGPISF